MGSGGPHLQNAYKKYGKSNFKKEYLFIFETKKEMYDKEIEIVNQEFIDRADTYNQKLGGVGGWDGVKRKGYSTMDFKKLSKQGNDAQKLLRESSEEAYNKFIAHQTKRSKRSAEVRKNTKVMYNWELQLSKYVHIDLIQEYISNGWNFGYLRGKTK
jgi:hypothetical protein